MNFFFFWKIKEVIIFWYSKFSKESIQWCKRIAPRQNRIRLEKENRLLFFMDTGKQHLSKRSNIERRTISIDIICKRNEGNPFAISLWFCVSNLYKTDFADVVKKKKLSNLKQQPEKETARQRNERVFFPSPSSFFRANKIQNLVF